MENFSHEEIKNYKQINFEKCLDKKCACSILEAL